MQVGNSKILDWDHTQLRGRAPDPSGRAVTFEYTAGDLDSNDDGEENDYTAEQDLTDKPDPATPGRGYTRLVGKDLPLRETPGILRAVL